MNFAALFLQNLSITDENLKAGLFAVLGALFLIFVFAFIALYIYLSFAYSSIAKKAKQKSPGIAWIPFIGPLIIVYKSSGMHWWPWILIAGFFLPLHFFSFVAQVVFSVVVVIWHWKLFEKFKYPGWWSLLTVIPFVNLIIIGIVAWSKR